MKINRADYDSPWKTMLRKHLKECLAFYFRPLHDAIDWRVPPKFLDKEFEKIAADSTIGNKRVDILVQVRLKNGREAWLLIHIEVQGQRVTMFTQQLFTYHYRIFDAFGRHPVTLAILSDDDPNWHPQTYEIDQFDFHLKVDFPTVKLLDYDEEQLMVSDNIFAMVTLAHLQTMAAGKDDDTRYKTKIRLARLLWKKGYDRTTIVNLFRFLDWMLRLPLKHQLEYREQVRRIEGVKMDYLNTWEETGFIRGVESVQQRNGMRTEIIVMIEHRFDVTVRSIVNVVKKLDALDLSALQDILIFVGVAKSGEDAVEYIENYDVEDEND